MASAVAELPRRRSSGGTLGRPGMGDAIARFAVRFVGVRGREVAPLIASRISPASASFEWPGSAMSRSNDMVTFFEEGDEVVFTLCAVTELVCIYRAVAPLEVLLLAPEIEKAAEQVYQDMSHPFEVRDAAMVIARAVRGIEPYRRMLMEGINIDEALAALRKTAYKHTSIVGKLRHIRGIDEGLYWEILMAIESSKVGEWGAEGVKVLASRSSLIEEGGNLLHYVAGGGAKLVAFKDGQAFNAIVEALKKLPVAPSFELLESLKSLADSDIEGFGQEDKPALLSAILESLAGSYGRDVAVASARISRGRVLHVVTVGRGGLEARFKNTALIVREGGKAATVKFIYQLLDELRASGLVAGFWPRDREEPPYYRYGRRSDVVAEIEERMRRREEETRENARRLIQMAGGLGLDPEVLEVLQGIVKPI